MRQRGGRLAKFALTAGDDHSLRLFGMGAAAATTWAEGGGPPLEGTPEMSGFGSKMIARSMSQQFDGAPACDWQPSGLVVTLRMRKARLAA